MATTDQKKLFALANGRSFEICFDPGEKYLGIGLRGEGRVRGDALSEVKVANLESSAGKSAD